MCAKRSTPGASTFLIGVPAVILPPLASAAVVHPSTDTSGAREGGLSVLPIEARAAISATLGGGSHE